jgi:6-phosphogluconolactonase/glucosamine-6-phosphate isomerase/deaminase
MKEHVVPSIAEPVGKIWQDLQATHTRDGSFSVASPLSSTPLPIYQWIIENAHQFENWDKVRFVLMDEMMEGEKPSFSYVSVDDPASYEGFARKNLLQPLHEKIPITTAIVKPEASHIADFNTDIDLLILALGVKGNYANVMPNTPEETGWHIAHLIPEFRQAHTQQGSQSYEGANFREYGMSLGPQQVLNAKDVVVVVTGEKKRDLVKELRSHDSFDPAFPLSIIYHPQVRDRVQIFITPDAA